MRHYRKGFTLVEIMIVVAIIALLAAIAIPNLLRARHNANESAAIAGLRTVSTAAESYRAAQTPPAYPVALINLSAATPPYIDTALSGATASSAAKQGYYYTYTSNANNQQYTCVASPQVLNTTGTRNFFVDETGVLRVGTTSAGTPIQ